MKTYKYPNKTEWAELVNRPELKKEILNQQVEEILKEVKNKPRVSILGWAFKKDTNDSRESSSIDVVKKLLENGIEVNIFDPMVSKEKILKDLDTLSKSSLLGVKVSST